MHLYGNNNKVIKQNNRKLSKDNVSILVNELTNKKESIIPKYRIITRVLII